MANVIRETNIKCIEWEVEFRPTNNTIASKTFMFQDHECYLEIAGGYRDLYFSCKSYLQKPLQVTVYPKVICKSSNSRSEIQNLQPQTGLVSSGHQCIWNNNLGYSQKKVYNFKVIVDDLSLKDADQNQKSLDTSNYVHFKALSRDFEMLLSDNSSCDVEITCEDKKFNTHRLVLGTRSPVLSAMLKSKMAEGKTGLIKIEDIKASIFECFLRYLYSGTLPKLNVDTAKQFYNVGDKYDVKELKTACSEFLTKNLSEANACEMLVLADQHSDATFQNDVISYIVDNKVPQRDSQWSNFCERYPLLAIKVQNLYIQKHCPK